MNMNMKKWLVFILMLVCFVGGYLLHMLSFPLKDVEYSKYREGKCLYPVFGNSEEKFCTFERYMWDGGFPDTIIVRFTRDGKFLGYHEARRYGLLQDSLGNYYSPGYIVEAYNGDNWLYDVKGKFIEFNHCVDSNNDDDCNYKP